MIDFDSLVTMIVGPLVVSYIVAKLDIICDRHRRLRECIYSLNKQTVISALEKWYSYYLEGLSVIYSEYYKANYFSWHGEPCTKDELKMHLLEQPVNMDDAPLSDTEWKTIMFFLAVHSRKLRADCTPRMPKETIVRLIDATSFGPYSFDHYMQCKDVREHAEKFAAFLPDYDKITKIFREFCEDFKEALTKDDKTFFLQNAEDVYVGVFRNSHKGAV